MEAMPGSSLEVMRPSSFFQLLMRLLADPPCLDGAGERLEGRAGV